MQTSIRQHSVRKCTKKIQNGEVPEKDMWRYSSFWYKNFDDMAMKTMLRQLISKWGVVSIEMENVLKERYGCHRI